MNYLPSALANLNPSSWTEPFWRSAAEHTLSIPRCASCAATRMPPGPCCWRCQGDALEWFEVPGTGHVHTFTVTRRAFHEALRDHVPYVLAVIALDGAQGARLISNVVDVDPEAVCVGLEVEAVWDDIEAGSVPRFRPAGSAP